MFNNKMKLFFITLVFMLSVSAVASAETNSTDDMTIGEVEEEPPSIEIADASTGEADNASQSEVLSSAEVINESSDDDSEVLQIMDDVNSTDNAVLKSQNDDVLSNSYSLKGSNVVMYYKNGSGYTVTLKTGKTPVKGETVSISINGAKYKRVTDAKGKAFLPINLMVGTYTVSAYFGGHTITNTVKILPNVQSSNLVKYYGNDAKFTAKFLNNYGYLLKNTEVSIIVHGKTYRTKTNSKGIASINIDLPVGRYSVMAVHPTGYKTSNKILIKSTITSSDLVKRYKSSKKVLAKFLDTNGNVMKGKDVKFRLNDKYYTERTDSNGVARLAVNIKPGSYDITVINPVSGERHKQNIKIYRTIYADSNINGVQNTVGEYKVKLYKNEKLTKGAIVEIHLKGRTYKVATNSDGVATFKYKLSKGTYAIQAVDSYTGLSVKTTLKVTPPTIRASDATTRANYYTNYKATVLNENGNAHGGASVKFTVSGKTYTVKANANGVAVLKIKLAKGTHPITIKDVSTGYSVTKKLTILQSSKGMKYNKYGVSSDGKTLLVVGRPSAVGETSKYGYTFHTTEFVRECTYCGGHNLYWGIFWAGNEHDDGGIFPATGHMETCALDGCIFCADCDCDWSIFGHNHGDDIRDLAVVSPSVSSSKDAAYELKSGNYVHP